jgi:hypothetical protein
MVAQAHGHAQFAQIAVGTSDFDDFGIHGVFKLGWWICLGSSFQLKPKNLPHLIQYLVFAENPGKPVLPLIFVKTPEHSKMQSLNSTDRRLLPFLKIT